MGFAGSFLFRGVGLFTAGLKSGVQVLGLRETSWLKVGLWFPALYPELFEGCTGYPFSYV